MSDQHWKDWEEYNHGLQGTATGSAHNQAGLADRTASRAPERPAGRRKAQAAPKRAAVPPRSSSSGNGNGLRYLIVAAVAIAAFVLLVPHSSGAQYIPYVGGVLAGAVANRFYKLILGAGIAALAVYLFAQSETWAAQAEFPARGGGVGETSRLAR